VSREQVGDYELSLWGMADESAPVSRTATAPFDRLKIFLITRPPDLGGTTLSTLTPQASVNGAKAIGNAVQRIFAEGGVRGFWVGNGLSIVKIFPESAIKFLSYESSVRCVSVVLAHFTNVTSIEQKRLFAQYWDEVSDTREISGVSRFLSGGIAGLTSQLCEFHESVLCLDPDIYSQPYTP
jgi:solute carrier family 25 phosphate transporter 23/24/25/41